MAKSTFRMRRNSTIILAAAAAAAGLLRSSGSASAASLTWTGGGGSDNWSDTLNWGGATPNGGDSLSFGGTTRLTPNNDAFGGVSFNNITFNAAAGAFVLGGNGITLGAPSDGGGGNQSGGGIVNNDGAGVTQTIDMNLTLAAGRHNFSTNTASGGLAFGTGATPISITRNPSAIIAFTASGGAINFTNASGISNDASGIIGAYATIGNDWAALDGSQNVVAYTGYTDLAAGGQAIASNPNSNIRLTGITTGNSTAVTGTVINTIMDQHTDATARTVTITGTMKLGGAGTNTGGIYRAGNAASTFTLTGGTVTANGGGELTFSSAPFNATTGAPLTIASIIANDSGAVSVTSVGYNVFSAANTYSGGTTIVQGRMTGSNVASFGNSAGIVTVLPGGQAFLNNNGTFANPFVLSGVGTGETSGGQTLGAIRMNTGATTISGQVTLAGNARIGAGSGATNTISGRITGNGRLEFTSATGSNTAMQISNSTNDWQGGLLLTNAGNADRAITVKLTNTGVLPDSNDVTLNGVIGAATLDINARNEAINGLTAANSANNIVTNSSTAGTLTIGAADGSSTFGGRLTGANLNITKTGAGTLTITSASTNNTFTGSATVSNGTLLLNPTTGQNNLSAASIVTSGSGVLNVASVAGGFVLGSQTLTNNAQVTGAVNAPNGSTVKGTGTFNNLLTLSGSGPTNGGNLSPGNSIGNINLSSGLTVSGGGQLSIEMDGASADLASVTGTAAVGGLGLNISVLNNNPPPIGSYTVLTATTLTGVPVINTPTIGRQTFSINGPALATNIIQVDVSGAPATVRWDNSLGGGDGINWEASTAANRKNWVNTGTGLADWFFQADSVIFNDTNNGKYAVTIPGTVNTGGIAVTNNSGNYSFSGPGSIAGGAVLTKSGNNALTISTTGNTYSGGTVVNAGTLNMGGLTSTQLSLGTGPLTLGNGITIDNLSGISNTIANNLVQTWNGNITFTGTSSLNMGTGAVTLGSNPVTLNVAKNTLTVGGIIGDGAGSQVVTKSGTGTLVVSGASTFQGPFNISSGIVTVGSANGTSASSLGGITGGNVTISPGATLNLGGIAANNGLNFGAKVFHVSGTGFNNLGAITNRDLSNPPGSVTTVGQQNAFQQIILDGNTTIGGPGNGPDGGAAARIDMRSTTGAHGAVLNLNGFDLTHLGNSKFTMVNTDVNGTGNMICFSDTTVALATGQFVGGSFAFESGTQILDDGGTSKIIMHDQTLLGFFNNGATGATSVTRRVEMGDGLPGSFTYIANGGGASSIGSNILLKGNLVLRSTFDNFQNNPLTLSGTISQDATARKLQKVNFNLLELAATTQNTFTGGLEIAPGAGKDIAGPIGNNGPTSTVQLDSQLALDPSNVVSFNIANTNTFAAAYSGVLQLNGSDVTVGGLTSSFAQGTQSAFVQNITGSATLTVNNASANTFGGVIRDNGGVMGLNKGGAGALILTSANTYSGTTTVTAGTLQVGNNGISGTLGTGPVVVNSTLAFNRSDSLTFAGSISGPGTVTQNTTGTLTLSGTNTHANTTINNGTVVIPQPATHSGAVNFASANAVLAGDSTNIGTVNLSTGSVHPGSSAADGVIGSVTIGSLNVTGGDLRIDIDTSDSSAGANDGSHDKIAVTNASFTAPSTISPFFLDGTPSAGNYTLITSTNAMTHTVNPTISGGGGSRLTFTPQFLSGNTILSLNITGSGADKTWVGNISNVWNVNTTANWTPDGGDNLFFNLDSTTFDDSNGGSPHSIVLRATSVTPSRMVVNTASSYTIDTNGKQITGVATSLYVQSGQLTLQNTGAAASNTFAGPINLDNNTTLVLGTGGTIGTGAIGATNANLKVNRSGTMTIGQTITGNVNLTVDSGGDVTLGGANAIPSGNLTVANGTLRATTATGLPSTVANISVGSGAASGLIDLGGGTLNGVTNLNTTGTGATNTIVNNSASTNSTINFIGSGTPSTFNGSINSGSGARAINLNMTGGNLTIAGGSLNTSSGSTSVLGGGVLTIGANSSLFSGALTIGERGAGSAPPAAGTVGTINLNNNSTVSTLTVPTNTASVNLVTIASNKTLTITGQTLIGTPSTATGDGTLATNLTMTGGGNLVIDTTGKSLGSGDLFIGIGQNNFGGGDTNIARVDLTGFNNFTYTTGATGTGRFGVGWMARPDAQLRLPAGANTIVTNNLTIGSSQGTPGFLPGGNLNGGSNNTTLFLGGGTNVINAAQINVGAIKGLGHIDWQTSTGSVVIAGQAGGTSRADITIGSSSSATGSANASTILLAGHNATVQGGTVIIGREAGGTTSGLNHLLSFDTGTFDVNNLQIALNTTGASPNGADGIFTLGNTSNTSTGTLTVNTQFALGLDSNTSAAPTKARFNVLGGTANINTNIIATTNDSDAGNVFLVNVDGGTLNMISHNIGDATHPITLTAQSGVIKNLAQLNAGGAFTKSGTGTLSLDGTNTYTGPTNVTVGTLQYITSHTTGSALNVSDGAVAYIKPSLATPNNVVVRTGSVSTGTTGKVDVGNNKMIVTGVGATGTWTGANYTGVTGLIASGHGTGNLWDGTVGIVTSQTAAIGSNFHSIGVAKASDVRPATATATGTWAGQTITGTDTLVMYTYGGDANLDGKINVDDYIKIDSGISAGLTGWSNGDFNYDGKVNIDDYTTVIDANIGNQTGTFPTAGGLVSGGGSGIGSGDISGVSAVPEPASVAVVGLGAAIGVLGRRRRRSM